MRITLKLYASFQELLPPDARHNSISIEIGEDETPNGVLDRFRVPRKLAHLVILNGIYIRPADRDKALFKEGDTLAIWPQVAGG